MRKWNGWGDAATEFPAHEGVRSLLRQLLGDARPLPDADLAAVLATVPASRLPAHPLIDASPEARLRHARGQSLPDWLALRSGVIGEFPDGVAEPASSAQVRELLELARHHDFVVIPYGGGTSVAGHVN